MQTSTRRFHALNCIYVIDFALERTIDLQKTLRTEFLYFSQNFREINFQVALIRMTSDGNLPVDQRRNYKSVFDAIIRIFKEEGLTALWRGAIPTMGRAAVVNAAQLASYSQAKQGILQTGYVQDGIFCHFLASMFSGLVTTMASMPVDIAKTRIQNQKFIDGKPEYKGAIDVIMKVVKNEGPTALWKGFTPYYFRLGPHTVLTFIFLEQMNKQYKIRVLGIKDAKGGGL